MWPTVDYLRAMFGESPPVPPIAEDERPYLTSPVGECKTLRTVAEGREETRTYVGHACAYFIGEQGRTSLVDLPPPARPQLVPAFDTTEMNSLRLDLGLNGEAEVR